LRCPDVGKTPCYKWIISAKKSSILQQKVPSIVAALHCCHGGARVTPKPLG
jgi:hypothetical protein